MVIDTYGVALTERATAHAYPIILIIIESDAHVDLDLLLNSQCRVPRCSITKAQVLYQVSRQFSDLNKSGVSEKEE